MRGRAGDRGGRSGYSDRGGRQGFDRDDGNLRTVEAGQFVRIVQGTAVYRLCTADKVVPLTQTFLYDQRKNKVGKVKDVFGPMDDVLFNCEPNEPNFLNGLKEGDKIYVPSDRLRPEAFFLSDHPTKRGGRGGGSGRGRFPLRGASRGGPRGRGGGRGGGFDRGRGGRGGRP